MSEPYPLAMFPLEQPVLPGAVVPLHVFEPRYRALARDLEAAEEAEFGIVGITRGREVGGADARADLGVVARVLQLQEHPDGRWSLVAGATRRVSVSEWLDPDPYPRALVTDRPDEFEADLHAALEPLTDAVDQLVQVARRRRPDLEITVPDIAGDDPDRAIWRLIEFAGLGPLDRLDLLACDRASKRATDAVALIADRAAVLDALGDL